MFRRLRPERGNFEQRRPQLAWNILLCLLNAVAAVMTGVNVAARRIAMIVET